MARNLFSSRNLGLAVAVLAVSLVGLRAGQSPGAAVPMDGDDIAGVVTGPNGPEAGVWVIAETRDLPTRHIKIVVTDDEGRYLVPDLPHASYDVWVRGYGLVDSEKAQAAPGESVNLTAVIAPNAKAAAEYYPAQDWFALLQLPAPSEFPGTGPDGNGIAPYIKSQGGWISGVVSTDGCIGCHALGNKATREIPAALGDFDSHVAAWDRRVKSGQAGTSMDRRLSQVGRGPALAMYGDWTDRIAAGEYPTTPPPRPRGIERNVVVSLWDWADPRAYMHDLISADKRNPTVNANGPVYGAAEDSVDYVPVLDPSTHTASMMRLQVRDPLTPTTASRPPMMPSPYWDDEVIWDSQSVAHSFAMDTQARVWIAARVRPAETPAFCQEGSSHPSAQAFPIERSNRQIQMWDPRTKELITLDTCFGTHHLNFAEDDKLWFTGSGPVVAWFDTKVLDETGDEALAQGWTVQVLDTSGNGRRDAYVEPGEPIDPTKDTRIERGFYGVAPSPSDGSIWGSTRGMPGGWYGSCRGMIRSTPRWRNSTRCRGTTLSFPSRGTRLGAWTSTATASCGRSCRAVTSRASTGGSATVRSMGQPPPESTAARAGHSIRSRDPTTRVRPIRAAPTRRTTTSPIGSTCWALAKTSRSQPATCPKACSRW